MPNKFRESLGTKTIDPFNRAVPGFSLTQEPGRWAWEKPPKFTKPGDAVDSVIDRLEEPETREEVAGLMLAGVSVEEIVNIFSVHGVDRGAFNPDVAEIIKGPLSMYLLGMADEFQIPVKLVGNEKAFRDRKAGLSDSSLLELMRKRNPEVYDAIMYPEPSEEQDRQMERYNRVDEESFLLAEEPDDMPEGPEDIEEEEV